MLPTPVASALALALAAAVTTFAQPREGPNAGWPGLASGGAALTTTSTPSRTSIVTARVPETITSE